MTGKRSLRVKPLLVVVLTAAACGTGEQGTSPSGTGPDLAGPYPLPRAGQEIALNPVDFVATIDHPYWPMRVGNRWVYEEAVGPGEPVQRVEVTVTDQTRTIMGIEATVVHDVVSEGGQVVEDTFDWYGQDRWGNLWYLGEDTKEFEDGNVVSTEGSWEAGVDGAQAGIILPGNPRVGMAYQQEYYEGEAEDVGEILSLDAKAQVPFGRFENALMTADSTPLEPKVFELKFYARGVGPVLAVSVSGGSDREELVRFEEG
jgi:hypothetical protein